MSIRSISGTTLIISTILFVTVFYLKTVNLLSDKLPMHSLEYIGLSIVISICIYIAATIYMLNSKSFYDALSAHEKVSSFPSETTRYAGKLLLCFTGAFVIGLIIVITAPKWSDKILGLYHIDLRLFSAFQEPMIMMLAAGIGSCIATFLGYLKHACDKEDFSVSYLPWYIIRPIMGMLLGLIFYFLIKGTLITVLTSSGDPAQKLDHWGLSGIGALVGIFSREAIEKLDEVFSVMFKVDNKSLEDEKAKRLKAENEKAARVKAEKEKAEKEKANLQ